MADEVVLIDTDVFSCVVVTPKDRDPRVTTWRRLLIGREVAVSAQTVGELLFGAFAAGWGARRLDALHAEIACRARLATTPEVVDAWARLRADCSEQGHALGHKLNMGDAWVAATAIAYDLKLLTGDGIYRGAPGLRLLGD